jgi:hypothetical protein
MFGRGRLFFVVCALGALEARAGATALEVALDYQASPGCPTRAEFAALVEQGLRATAAVTWVEAGAHPSVAALVAANGGSTGYSAQVTLIDAEGQTADRVVSGAQCADVTAAAALMASVFLAPSLEPQLPGVEARPAVEASPRAPFIPSIEVGAGIRNAVTPSIAPAGVVGVAFAREGTALLSPLIDVALGYSHQQLSTAEGTLAGDSVLATGQLCLLKIGGRYVAARACLAAEGGLQLAHWTQGPQGLRTGGWLAGGLGLQAGGPITSRLSWSVSGTGTVAALRSRFFDTTGTLYASPLFSFGLNAGLRFSIW